jgi:D-alanine transaminase
MNSSSSKSRNKIVYLNHQYIPESQASISIFDRGFLFADGVYEVIPVYNGIVAFLSEHLIRLQNSLDSLKIKYKVDHKVWQDICNKLVANNGPDCPIYIQITRGNENLRNHDFAEDITPTLLALSLAPVKLGNSLNSQQIKVVTLPDNRWNHCDIKSIALLGNILLRQEGRAQQAEEVLLVRENGHIVEGTTTNYFIVKNNTIITPPLNHEILPGITRQIIINLCKAHDIKLVEKNINLAELISADEVWLSSSTKEIRPVTKVNNTVINNGQPGKMWQKMINLYIDYIKKTYYG